MELETLDYAWRTKDDAKICFSRYTNLMLREIGDDPPTILTAVRNNSCLVEPPTIEIPLSELKLIASTKCEVRNGWNSNTSCGAYQWDQPHRKPGLVIYQVNGTGNHFMFMHQLELLPSFREICKSGQMRKHPIVVWDLIQSWFSTYGRGKVHATDAVTIKYEQAFVDGRLKKRKNRGAEAFKVWIEEPAVYAATLKRKRRRAALKA